MTNPISDQVHASLSRSLPLLQAHKATLIDAMRESLGTGRPEHRLPGRPHAAASALVEMLVGRVRRYLEAGDLGDLGEVIDEHRALALDGRHYSRFGDALAPVLKDVLGPTLPREVAAAWCDAFWTIIRAARDALEAAPGEITHRRHAIV